MPISGHHMMTVNTTKFEMTTFTLLSATGCTKSIGIGCKSIQRLVYKSAQLYFTDMEKHYSTIQKAQAFIMCSFIVTQACVGWRKNNSDQSSSLILASSTPVFRFCTFQFCVLFLAFCGIVQSHVFHPYTPVLHFPVPHFHPCILLHFWRSHIVQSGIFITLAWVILTQYQHMTDGLTDGRTCRPWILQHSV